MVIKVDDTILDSFLPLIPEEVQDYTEESEIYCLGCVRDDTAVGILIFSLSDGVNKSGDPEVIIMLYWLYTAEDYRKQGIAGELLKALFDIVRHSPDSVIICNIPMGLGYDQSVDFFASHGFELEANEIPVMEISKEDFREHKNETNQDKVPKSSADLDKPEGLVSLDTISKVKFRKTIKKMLEDEEFTYYYNLTDERDAYDKDLSYAIMKNDEVTSMVLFRRTRSDELHMVMLDAASNAEPREMLDLLRYSAGKYFLDKPDDLYVRLTLWKEKSRKLAEHIFPHKDVFRVRRGYSRQIDPGK
ncbi:MAG: GNAT family N-acetyltransferase [Lachnospiraceae bacterium]|nr:GNAT family N-acetyltransferase [Lachnospiraceae bacterium]